MAFSGQMKTKTKTRSGCCNASSTCRNTRSSCWNARRTCACARRVICFSQQFHYMCCCRVSLRCSSWDSFLSQQPLLVFQQLTTCVSAAHLLCFSNSLLVFQQLLLVFQQLLLVFQQPLLVFQQPCFSLLQLTTVRLVRHCRDNLDMYHDSGDAKRTVFNCSRESHGCWNTWSSCWNTSSNCCNTSSGLLKHK